MMYNMEILKLVKIAKEYEKKYNELIGDVERIFVKKCIKLNIINDRHHVWSEYHPYVLVVLWSNYETI